MSTDIDLARQTLEGDDDSFAELVRRHLPALFSFIVRIAESRTEAEDIAQDAFFRAWKHLARFDQNKNFKTWLYTIAKRLAFDTLKRKRPDVFAALDADGKRPMSETVSDPALPPSYILDRKDLSAALEAAMGELDPEERTILILHYHEDFTFEAIAEILKRPMNTLKSRHRRALDKLRTHLTMHQNVGSDV